MPEKPDDKKKKYIENIEKLFGKKSGIFVPDPTKIVIEKFPTGSLKLDIALKGGYPKGTMIELFGSTGAGKTSSAIEAVAQHQKCYPDEVILWLDLEGVFDPVYFQSIGVDINKNFILLKPQTGEQSYEAMLSFIKEVGGGLIVVDSVTTLLPEKEDESSVGEASIALGARLNSQGVRKIFPHMRKNNTTIFFLNQQRANIANPYKPIVTTGGNTIPYYCRTRLQMNGSKGEDGISTGVNIKLEKANYGSEKSKVETEITYGEGFDLEGEVIDLGIKLGVIEKAGSWFSHNGAQLGQGKNSVREMFQDNPEFFEQLVEQIRTKYDLCSCVKK